MTQPFRPEDLFLYQTIADADVRWQDDAVAYCVQSIDAEGDSTRSALWIALPDGGAPKQLTAAAAVDNSPHWSPDGTRLGFISDRHGLNQVFALPMDGGEPVQLGTLPGAAMDFAWSPDGSHIAATCSMQVDSSLRGGRPPPGSKPPPQDAPRVCWKLPYKVDGIGFELNREVHLFVVDVRSGEARRLTDGPFNVRSFCWAPDGKRIVFTRTREGDAAHCTDLWICEPDGSNARQCTHEQSQVLYPAWSPDGRIVVFSGTIDEGDAQVRLWQLDVAAGVVDGLGDEHIEISSEGDSVQFRRGDSTRLYAVVARRGVQELAELAMPQGQLRTVAGGERQISRVACGNNVLFYAAESPVDAVELFQCGLDGGGETRRTNLNGWWRERTAATCERRVFELPDGHNGTMKIDGWLIRPHDAHSPGPLLADVHGGPASYVLFDHQPLAYWPVLWSRGWSILALNAIGSASYGRTFAQSLRGHWGELDLSQHLAAVEQLRDEGVVDARLAICGKSYGGFMAAWAIGRTRAFRAAVVMAPVSNIETHFGTSDSGYYSDPYALDGDRIAHRETMRRLSPTQYAERAVTPTLILQGDADERCPKAQSEELFVSMRRGANPPCELVLYPGGSHKFTSQSKPSHRRDAMQRIVDWLERWIDTPVAGEEGEAARTADTQSRGRTPH